MMYSPTIHVASNTMNNIVSKPKRPNRKSRRAGMVRQQINLAPSGYMPSGQNNLRVAPPRPPKPNFRARAPKPLSFADKRKRLSKCAADYLCALEDPFDCIEDVCVPLLPCYPSRKTKVFTKGTLTVGTAGFGFITSQVSTESTNNSTFYSQGTYTGTTIATAVATGVAGAKNNSDLTQTQFGSFITNLQSRVVGFGIRVMYTGSDLNKSGDIRVLEEPNHADLTGASNVTFDAYDKSSKFQVTREWTSVSFHPVFPGDTDYSGTPQPVGTNYFLGIAINSLSQNTFDFEVYGIFEIIGTSARGKTPSMTDTVGVDAVLNVVQAKSRDGFTGSIPLSKELSMADMILNGLSSLAKIVPAAVQGMSLFM